MGLFVAGFIGSPAMNLVEARIEGGEVVVGQFRIPLAVGRRRPGMSGAVILGIRPDRRGRGVRIARTADDDTRSLCSGARLRRASSSASTPRARGAR
jgi:hypothetical protein